MNYDQQVRLATASDTGEDNAASVQPPTNDEALDEALLGRSIEHLRRRTETLRQALEETNYFLDYDRGLLLRATGAFTLTQDSSGHYVLALATGAALYVHPALTPGPNSGGRWYGGRVFCENVAEGRAFTPYSGLWGTNDLTLTADSRVTGQRGYADGNTFAGTSIARSLGANRITVDLVASSATAGGVGGIVATVTKSPATHVTITYGTAGTPTTLDDLITFINGDRTSQGSYGIGDLLYATTTGPVTNAPTPFTGGQVQGAYDAEVHAVPYQQFTGFFDALDAAGAPANHLREGEGLALSYVAGAVDRVGYLGGRRQSITDLPTNRTGGVLDNTTPSVGYLLFNTGREPEKIPGAIPIGKIVNGEFVFIDGTRLGVGDTLYLGESRSTYAVLAVLTAGSSGARRIGYEGSGNWNSDASASAHPSVAAGSIYAALTQIVADLASQTTSQSGGRRVGNEALTGTADSLQATANTLSLSAGSLRAQFLALLNTAHQGINGRVSELGHVLLGNDPLRKDGMRDGTITAGVRFLEYLMLPEELQTVTGAAQYVQALFTPLKYDAGGGDNLDIEEPAEVASATVLHFTSMSSPRMVAVFGHLAMVLDSVNSRQVFMLYARVDVTGAADAPSEIYAVVGRDTTACTITLKNLDNSDPDFTGGTGVAITLLTSCVLGRDHRHSLLRLLDFVGAVSPQTNPLGVIGAGHVDARLLDVYTPNGTTGTLGMRVFPNRIEFGSKSTANLLGASDKALLDGVETSTVVDATASHHHGTVYSGLVPITLEDHTDTLDNVPTSTPGDTKTVTSDAGTTPVGVIIDYEFQVFSSGAGATSIMLMLTNVAGDILGRMYVSWTAAGGGEQQDVYGQLTIPLTSGTYYIQRGASSNVDLATSNYTLHHVGKFLGKA